MKKKILITIVLILYLSIGFIYFNYYAGFPGAYIEEMQEEEEKVNDREVDTEYCSDIQKASKKNQDLKIFDAYRLYYGNMSFYSEDENGIKYVTRLSSKYESEYRKDRYNVTFLDDSVYYSYLDIDKDGTDELIFTSKDTIHNTLPLEYIDAIYRHKSGSKTFPRYYEDVPNFSYEYELVINNEDEEYGSELYLTENNHIYYKDRTGKETLYRYSKGKLEEKKFEDPIIRTDYNWKELPTKNKNNDKVRSYYQSIVKKGKSSSTYSLLNVYGEGLDLYEHIKGNDYATLYHYDRKTDETDTLKVCFVYDEKSIPILLDEYTFISYLPGTSRLETYYYQSLFGDHGLLIHKQYEIKNGKWLIRGLKCEDTRLLQDHSYEKNYNDEYTYSYDDYVGEKNVYEFSQEEILEMLENY